MHIMLADGQSRVRFALRVLLGKQAGYTIAGEAADVVELLASLQSICPDVLLLDWELPGLLTSGGLSAVREPCPQMTIVALSGKQGAGQAALAAGADAFVSKGEPPDCLLAALRGCPAYTREEVVPC